MLGDWVAENRLSELRATAAWPSPGVSEGSAEQAGRSYRWREEVKTTPTRCSGGSMSVFGPTPANTISRLSGYVARPLQ
jgi:general secretion pathway protein I